MAQMLLARAKAERKQIIQSNRARLQDLEDIRSSGLSNQVRMIKKGKLRMNDVRRMSHTTELLAFDSRFGSRNFGIRDEARKIRTSHDNADLFRAVGPVG